MPRHFRVTMMLVLVPVMLLAGTDVAIAKPGTNTGKLNCGRKSGSAIDQYCELIPTATGGQSAGSGTGTPGLGTSLPPGAVMRLIVDPKHGRLLTLPAPPRAKHRPATGATVLGKPAGSSVDSTTLWLPMLLLLAAIALMLAVAEFIRRRRHRRRAGGTEPGTGPGTTPGTGPGTSPALTG